MELENDNERFCSNLQKSTVMRYHKQADIFYDLQ